MEKYIELITDFLKSGMGALDFESVFLRMFKNETEPLSGEVYDILDSFFADVDMFTSDESLKEEGDLDEAQLRESAKKTLYLLNTAVKRDRPEGPLLLYGRELLYLSVPKMMDAYIRQADKNETIRVCMNLLSFSYEKGLLIDNPHRPDGEFRRNYEVYERNLTEEGKLYFEDLMYRWLEYTDRTNKTDNVKMLEKWYAKLTGNKK